MGLQSSSERDRTSLNTGFFGETMVQLIYHNIKGAKVDKINREQIPFTAQYHSRSLPHLSVCFSAGQRFVSASSQASTAWRLLLVTKRWLLGNLRTIHLLKLEQ